MNSHNNLQIIKLFTFKNVLLSTALLLCIPLIAMQLSNEVNWTSFDFLVAGTLLVSLGSLMVSIIRIPRFSLNQKRLLIISIVLFGLLVWLELAVGIFNSPLAGN